MGRGGLIALGILVIAGVGGLAWYFTQSAPVPATNGAAIQVSPGVTAPVPPPAPSNNPPDAAASPPAPATNFGTPADPIVPKADEDIPFPPDCVVPGPSPVMPRGAVATLEDMQVGHTAIQGFVKALEAYQACLESHIAKDAATTTPRVRQVWRNAGNSAVDASNLLARAYAQQWKVFKAREPTATTSP